MTVTYPVVERIRRAIVSRVETILVEGVESAFASDVVEPLRVEGYSPTDYQIVVTQDDCEINEDLALPGNPPGVCHEQVFNLRCKLMTSESDEVSIYNRMNVFAMDVQRRFTSYPNWYWVNGLAIDARFGAMTPPSLDGGAAVANLPLTVVYRVSEYDPYILRS